MRDGLVALWQACDLTRPWNDPDADIGRAMANATSTILVIRENGTLIGSAMTGYDGHRGWVYYVATAPEARGRGVAAALMTAAEDWLRDRGCPKIELMVRDTNTAALGFYHRLGYEHQPVSVKAKWLIDPDA